MRYISMWINIVKKYKYHNNNLKEIREYDTIDEKKLSKGIKITKEETPTAYVSESTADAIKSIKKEWV